MRDFDFTREKYKTLCKTFLEKDYHFFTVYRYLKERPEKPFVIMRHDIDYPPLHCTLKMAEVEHDLGIASTYYFRYTPSIFNRKVMKKVEELGHEIGYHYEVMHRACGDVERAIELFISELSAFKKDFDVKTIAMHGSPLSRFDNRDIWKLYDFSEYGIAGEAYLSMNEVPYYSDTGRSWSGKNSIRDFMPGKESVRAISTTDELIHHICTSPLVAYYITVHPERWTDSWSGYTLSYLKDLSFNMGKRGLKILYSWNGRTVQ